MTLTEFAETHRLKICRDDCGEKIIHGKFGHIFAYDRHRLGVLYMPDPKGLRAEAPKHWNNRKRTLTAAGCRILLDGDSEGLATFDPANEEQSEVSIRIAGCKRKRVLSEEEVAKLITRLPPVRPRLSGLKPIDRA